MAFDEDLADRMRAILAPEPGLTERKMFGGIAFMLNGNMVCGVIGKDLMARIGAERYDEALDAPHVRPMDFSGRPMVGLIYVSPDGVASDDALRAWVDVSLDYARALPPRSAEEKAPRRSSKKAR